MIVMFNDDDSRLVERKLLELDVQPSAENVASVLRNVDAAFQQQFESEVQHMIEWFELSRGITL